MSGRGNSTDNAVCESFFFYFKAELLVGNNLVSRKQMKIQVYEYIENWYNKKRMHSFLGFKMEVIPFLPQKVKAVLKILIRF